MSEWISAHLGQNADERKRQLEQVAARVGAIGQRGPSISVLLRMIADGELEVNRIMQRIEYTYSSEAVLGSFVDDNEEAVLYAWEQHIDQLLSNEYPDADVTVLEGAAHEVKIFDATGDVMEENERVNSVIERTWLSFEWYPE